MSSYRQSPNLEDNRTLPSQHSQGVPGKGRLLGVGQMHM